MSTGVSRSWNTRSAAVIADWRTAYFCEKSRIGMKNFCTYSMNATSVPKAIAPRRISPELAQTTRPIEIELTASTIENSAA
jgi:hypothetical protein